LNLLVVSDLHLNPETSDRNKKFVHFLEYVQTSGDRLLILGDLFDLWFGWKQLQFEFQADIINRMNNLAEMGLHIDYVEGNRDFGIGFLERRPFQKVFSKRMELHWGDRIIAAEHGDLINRADRQYRAFRKLTKNAMSYFLISHLPASWLLAFSIRLEKSLKNTNQTYRVSYPEDYCKEFREEAFRRGADIVLAGHFHQERTVKEQLNSRRVMFYNLPGWESGFRYLVIPQDREEPYFADFEV